MTQSKRSDKMATWPVGKLLYSMSIPAVISMLIQAMYNIVDTMYVSQLGTDALFAMGLVYPLQMIVISVALGGAVGTSTIIARRLGEKRPEEADQTYTTGVFLSLFHYACIALVGCLAAKPFLGLFTSNAEVIAMGNTYLVIVMGVSIGCVFGVFFERVLQATGNVILPMISQIIGAVTNIVLDPIFIFGGFGIPAMGIQGAAIATIIGQILAACFLVVAMIVGKHEVHFKPRLFRVQSSCTKTIYSIGLPVMVMNAIGSLTTTLMNGILVAYSELAVSALTIYFKVQSFVFMPVFGFNQGALPILSYNFGAGNEERFHKTTKIYALTSVTIMVIGTLLFLFGTEWIWSLFNPEPNLLAVGVPAFRIISSSFIIAAATICMITIYQAIGMGFSSMLVSVSRQILFLIPLAYIFAKLWGVIGVWISYPVAELLVVILFLPKLLKATKTKFKQEEELTHAG